MNRMMSLAGMCFAVAGGLLAGCGTRLGSR